MSVLEACIKVDKFIIFICIMLFLETKDMSWDIENKQLMNRR